MDRATHFAGASVKRSLVLDFSLFSWTHDDLSQRLGKLTKVIQVKKSILEWFT
jgi:hypothetical protein